MVDYSNNLETVNPISQIPLH